MTMTTAAAGILTGTYHVDSAHSRIGFVARHAMITKVRGSFTSSSGLATSSPWTLP
jgi:polyisoprenoid-binding protein YceI